jgi:hypothetical protein
MTLRKSLKRVKVALRLSLILGILDQKETHPISNSLQLGWYHSRFNAFIPLLKSLVYLISLFFLLVMIFIISAKNITPQLPTEGPGTCPFVSIYANIVPVLIDKPTALTCMIMMTIDAIRSEEKTEIANLSSRKR